MSQSYLDTKPTIQVVPHLYSSLSNMGRSLPSYTDSIHGNSNPASHPPNIIMTSEHTGNSRGRADSFLSTSKAALVSKCLTDPEQCCTQNRKPNTQTLKTRNAKHVPITNCALFWFRTHTQHSHLVLSSLTLPCYRLGPFPSLAYPFPTIPCESPVYDFLKIQ